MPPKVGEAAILIWQPSKCQGLIKVKVKSESGRGCDFNLAAKKMSGLEKSESGRGCGFNLEPSKCQSLMRMC